MANAPVLVLATPEIRRQLQTNLAKPQTSICIVTPFIEDVQLGTARTVQTFFASQMRAGTEVLLFTTPPDLTKEREFRRKYGLLESFSVVGVRILLNDLLHAKAFCFNYGGQTLITLVGSANLTTGGLGQRLELAIFSARPHVYHATMAHIRIFERGGRTEEYLQWKRRHHLEIQRRLEEIKKP